MRISNGTCKGDNHFRYDYGWEEDREGDTVVFNLEDRCCTGVFMGIGKKGALMFDSKIVGTGVRFHIMPKSIKEIYKAEVKVDMGFMNPPAEKEREE